MKSAGHRFWREVDKEKQKESKKMCLSINIENLRIKMKKLFKTLPLVLIVMSIYSCTSDDETVQDVNDNSSVVTTFTCTQENDGTTTKAALGSEGKILWESGDAISIFDGNKANYKYSLGSESNWKVNRHFFWNRSSDRCIRFCLSIYSRSYT